MIPGVDVIKDLLATSGEGAHAPSPVGDNHGSSDQFQIEQPELRALFSFWKDKLESLSRLPARSDFKPTDLRKLLPHIALVDVKTSANGPDFTFRLCGTQIAEDCGADLTGKTWASFPNTEMVIDRARRLVDDLKPYYVGNLRANWAPKDFLHYSVLALPLSSDNKTVDMILYGVVFHLLSR